MVSNPLIFGTSCLGNLYQALGREVKKELVKSWFKYAKRPVIIDTAGKYGAGLALEMIGDLLRELNIESQEIIISNKLGWYRVPLTSEVPNFEPGIWQGIQHDAVQKIDRKGMLDCYEQGLKLLNGYPVSMVSVHDPDEYLARAETEAEKEQRMEDILEAYQALFELKNKGEVSSVGIGAKDWQVIRELSNHISFDWVMFATSFTILKHPAELLSFIAKLHQDGVNIINSAVFHAGFLTGGQYFDYRTIDPNHPGDEKLLLWRESFYKICHKYAIKAATACVQFACSAPGIAQIALNTSRPERIKEQVEIFDEQIPADFWKDMIVEGLIAPTYPYV